MEGETAGVIDSESADDASKKKDAYTTGATKMPICPFMSVHVPPHTVSLCC